MSYNPKWNKVLHIETAGRTSFSRFNELEPRPFPYCTQKDAHGFVQQAREFAKEINMHLYPIRRYVCSARFCALVYKYDAQKKRRLVYYVVSSLGK